MKIEVGYPPNINKIGETFKLDGFQPVFTYGDTIYSPYGEHLTDDLIVHETMHMLQQKKSPELWWDRYMTDEDFRLEQELVAYGAQYAFFCGLFKDRNARFKFLFKLAADLSSGMYGDISTHAEALRNIRIHSGVPDKHFK